jgi:uncharacterized protein (TIGR00369 family)
MTDAATHPVPAAPGPAPARLARPSDLFGVGGGGTDRTSTWLFMRTGEWLRDEFGAPCAGALGVLVDNVLGHAVARAKPGGQASVTTELSIDFLRPLPIDGTLLRATGSTQLLDGAGGMSSGRVTDEAGRTIALGTLWGRYVPGGPRLPKAGSGAAAGPEPVPEAGLTGSPDLASALALSIRPAGSGTPGPDVSVRLPLELRLSNPRRMLHGGVAACVSELAGCLALRGPAGAAPAEEQMTASLRISYLRPSPIDGVIDYTTRVIHRGRALGVVEVVGVPPGGAPCTVATITRRGIGRLDRS